MGATFAGRPTQDPSQELANCLRMGTPVDHWAGKCNRFACPTGVLPGTGMVLMLRGDLDRIDQNTPQTLEFTDPTSRLALRNIHVVRALCVSPGAPADPNAVYAVELADKRRRLALSACNLGFNLRSSPGGRYVAATAAGPSLAYTWAEIWNYVWLTLPGDVAGSTPALPATPQGDPEGFDFYGVSSMDAIGQFLARLGWDLVLNPVTDVFSVVEIGSTQPGFAAAEARNLGRRLHDLEPIEPAAGRIPASLIVQFPRRPVTYGLPPWETKTATPDGGALAGEAGTLILFDDLTANYSTGVLSNDADLTARATARAADFYRVARASQTLRRVYSGLPSDLTPGSEVRRVTWSDGGRDGGGGAWAGVTTEIDRRPPLVDKWPGNRPPSSTVIADAVVKLTSSTPTADGYPANPYVMNADGAWNLNTSETVYVTDKTAEGMYLDRIYEVTYGGTVAGTRRFAWSVQSADRTHSGTVNLLAQWLGAGQKKVESLGVGYNAAAPVTPFATVTADADFLYSSGFVNAPGFQGEYLTLTASGGTIYSTANAEAEATSGATGRTALSFLNVRDRLYVCADSSLWMDAGTEVLKIRVDSAGSELANQLWWSRGLLTVHGDVWAQNDLYAVQKARARIVYVGNPDAGDRILRIQRATGAPDYDDGIDTAVWGMNFSCGVLIGGTPAIDGGDVTTGTIVATTLTAGTF